jgi:formylglycine-generating enzyme
VRALALFALFLASCASKPQTWTEPFTGIEFVPIPRGEFTMGSQPGEVNRQDDEVPHRVVIAKPFYMAATEVTQAQWMKVMGANPSNFPNPNAPVERITWHDVQLFLQKLNARGNGRFRLPTEEEWEYACRAGTTTAYAFGNELKKSQANYDGPSTVAVKSFTPNAWGLYDMHGNVWEWCATEYCPYPAAACGSKFKVIRGGSWHFGADSARSALRYTHEPHLRGFSIGFRLVRDAD